LSESLGFTELESFHPHEEGDRITLDVTAEAVEEPLLEVHRG
jgi:hypothetical protein